MPGLHEKTGFIGFCFDTFEASCKEGSEACLDWQRCYEKFSHEAPAAESMLKRLYKKKRNGEFCTCTEPRFNRGICDKCGGKWIGNPEV